jgi:ATP/maltotriose-dependent transcriptional regulator MalT
MSGLRYNQFMQPAELHPISKIKVRVPYRRRELISRMRLIEAIYEQLEKQLLLIVAPAGYGKTTFINCGSCRIWKNLFIG